MSAGVDTGVVEAAIANARPDDPAGRVLARARVEAALFGSAIGPARFHVRERLGSGGMGVVYAAYDPELDRRVALKMLGIPEAGRELALAEAKALARLSHPNIVPVFDVGVIEDHVYFVMELIRGVTLREWVTGKSVHAILEAYLQAGAGLAAAHAAGLIHRDFKPDNVIVGSDGRVRVVDFGLACNAEAWLAESSGGEHRIGVRIAGTPRYMAPEQSTGTVTAMVDQYSFCVSLDEALRGKNAGPPRWLSVVIERGRATDPAKRFASMTELLRALGRDPSRTWRRRIGFSVAAAAVVAAFFAGASQTADEPKPCSGGDIRLEGAWPRWLRDAQLAHLTTFGPLGAEVAERIATRLDNHAAQWIGGYRDACLARLHGELSDVRLDRRMTCLTRSLATLAAIRDHVAVADARAVPVIALVATALRDPAECADLDALTIEIVPPSPAIAPRIAELRDQLEHARVQLIAGRSTTARAAAHAVAAELRVLDYGPLLAEALLLEGHASQRIDPTAARLVLDAAMNTAFESHCDATGVEACARRAWIDGNNGSAETALANIDIVKALAARMPAGFARALLYNNIGSVELVRGRRSEARLALHRALREAEHITGSEAIELMAIRRNLAIVTDDPVERDQISATGIAALARLVGNAHPDVLRAQYMRATISMLDLAAARDLLAATCDRATEYDELVPLVPMCFLELGDLHEELGNRTAAVTAYERAHAESARAVPVDDTETREVAGYLALWGGDPSAASWAFEAAIEASPVENGNVYTRFIRGKQQLGYARALRAAGRLADARKALESSVAALAAEELGSQVAVQRRLGRTRAELAEVLAASGGPSEQVHALAEQALAWYRTAGAPLRRLDELAALAVGRSR